MVFDKSRPYWAEPRATDPPGPMRRDWLFVAVAVIAATIETFVRDDLVWSGVSLAVTVGAACLLPWRRVHPLLVVALAFGAMSAIEIVSLVRDVEWEGAQHRRVPARAAVHAHALGFRTGGQRRPPRHVGPGHPHCGCR